MIRYRYSRLGKIQENHTKAQIAALFLGSIAIIFLIIKVGFPALFGLTSFLASFHQKTLTPDTGNASLEIAPVPSLNAQYSATSSARVKLSGASDPNVSVVIVRNGDQQTSLLTDNSGNFDYLAELTKGSNKFSAQTVNAQGKKSVSSEVVEVVNITGNPNLEIGYPTDGQNFAGQDSLEINGKTDPGVAITVNDSSAIVGTDGVFKFFYRLKSGDNKLTIVATDQAGNLTKKELTIKGG